MRLDVGSVRKHFPALEEGAAHFDAPGGSQVPDVVAEAVATTLRSAIANRGRTTVAERRADDIVLGARQAMSDLIGADQRGIVFGRSMTQLTYDFSRAIAETWAPGDEIVVSRLDHDANIRPWIQAAARAGATVRWIDFDPSTGELGLDDVAVAVSSRTRLVAVTAASNLTGTRPPVADIVGLACSVGALVYVDGVHLTPHAPVDASRLGADFYVCSPYKFFGPHCGVLAGRPSVLEALHPDKLLPSSDAVPERFELGTLPYELLAGATAAVEFIAGLAPGDGRSRRERVVTAMTAIEAHEEGLRQALEARLAAIEGVRLYGRAAVRTPTLLFGVGGVPAAEVCAHLAGMGVNAPAGNFYAMEASRHLGLGDEGAVRAGIAPYTDEHDIDRLVAGVVETPGRGR